MRDMAFAPIIIKAIDTYISFFGTSVRTSSRKKVKSKAFRSCFFVLFKQSYKIEYYRKREKEREKTHIIKLNI